MKPPIKLPEFNPEDGGEGEEALAEGMALAAGVKLDDPDEIASFNRKARGDAIEGHIHRVLVFGMYFVTVCAALMFGALVINVTVTPKWRFLDAAQQAELYKFLFSGALGAGVTAVSKRLAKAEGAPPPEKGK